MANVQANIVGSMEPYVPGTLFSQYAERFEHFFEFNQTPDERKRSLFITLSGPIIFNELKLLYPGQNLNTVNYNDMIARLKARFDKEDTDVVQCFKLESRIQTEDETVESFILDLKLIASQCDLGDYKEKAIRNRILVGIRDKDLQRELLKQDRLTLQSAERIVTQWELASNRAKILGSNHHQNASVGSVRERLGRAVHGGNRYQSTNERNVDYRSRSRSRGDPRSRRVSFDHRSSSRNRESRYANLTCNRCGQKGHIKRLCNVFIHNRAGPSRADRVQSVAIPAPSRNTVSNINQALNRLRVEMSEESEEENSGDFYWCMMVSNDKGSNRSCLVDVVVEGHNIIMEVDTGSAVSVMGENMFQKIFSVNVFKSNRKLVVVNGGKLDVLGEANVWINLNNHIEKLPLVILKENVQRSSHNLYPLLGREWLDVFFPRWRDTFARQTSSIKHVSVFPHKDSIIAELKTKFSNVFEKDFSEPIRGYEAELVLKDNKPIFKKAYDVPYGLREKVLEHLEKLEKENVITPIETSEWASPVIAVVKKNQDIRLVIDCKVSINKCIIPNTYPLPVAQDIFAKLSGCTTFCVLDLEGAYTQLSLSEKSKKFMVINTIKGLFTYNRLPQGVSSSCAIFQSTMERILDNIEGVSVYLDDVLISGRNAEECKKRLILVLKRLSIANIKVNWQKCKFFVSELSYLGHIISHKGLSPCPDKLTTIKNASIPRNTTELKSYLGLINYYGKFVPKLAFQLSPLYKLLKKDSKFNWTIDCQKSFELSKNALLKSKMLDFYDPTKPLVVITDACNYGLGGVLAQVVNGEEKPISFTSFSLNNAQKSYPILHLEALALVCTIKKFHKYLYGHKFTVYTDHKPLMGIFGKEGKNSIFVTRLQRYILELSIYDFEICYRKGEKLANADFCSRFPLLENVPPNLDTTVIQHLNYESTVPLDYSKVAMETEKDNILNQVSKFVQLGWPQRIEKEFKNMFSKQVDLEIMKGCLLFQNRVVIPKSLIPKILKLLHVNHSGIVKMKQLARKTVYWEGINSNIEQHVRNCITCCRMAIEPTKVKDSYWIPTTKPFSRIHADFFYLGQKIFLIIVDSYSKWIEIEWMKHGTDASKVIKKFAKIFSVFGLPDIVVTDNGPPFSSQTFINFLKNQGIEVLKSPPYHPSSNGQAERMVRLVKDVLKKYMLEPEIKSWDTEDQLNYFLFNYRNTCVTSEERFPSEKIFKYRPKTLIDLINPKYHFSRNMIEQPVEYKHRKQITVDKNKSSDKFESLVLGDKVWIKNYRQHEFAKWIEASFIKRISLNTFQVACGSVTTNVHKDQMRIQNRMPSRQNILVPIVSKNRKRKLSIEDEEDFEGFGNESKLCNQDEYSNEINSELETVRRSARIKNKRIALSNQRVKLK
ncbi:uncharacterized protein K02A2.6-like [Uranotaenia lowii]|uniref:uncharacterized protein K02A2.6-like n=1 Tax=Uranotaenia lowii TaxID=190385 RepID=UPI00247AED45|nr:uncharacterized protein K02A2.6-like [Uranotaenia lowii]